MNPKKIALLGMILTSIKLFGVTVPDWYNSFDNLLGQIDAIEADIEGQTAYFIEWDAKLKPWCDKLEEQNKVRRELFNCVRDSFAAKDKIIRDLNITLAEKQNIILDIQNNISSLEAIIAGLNGDLSTLNQQLSKLRAAYATLLELDAAKAAELLSEISLVKSKYEEMVAQRDLFRVTLQSFYQCAKSYSHVARTETSSFSTELGCETEEI